MTKREEQKIKRRAYREYFGVTARDVLIELRQIKEEKLVINTPTTQETD